MTSYKKVYLKFFGIYPGEWIECEGCGGTASDIHHIDPRSTDPEKLNDIYNLAALCRKCHNIAGANPAFNNEIRIKHENKVKNFSGNLYKSIVFCPEL